ncbi:MAG TPA: histone deacetylase [Burkholderiaceae bacterium]|nr:histone deacetylase [Burkholderiaceae bacterium]
MASPAPLIKAFSTDQFELPLPQGHRFPMVKYRWLRESLNALEQIEVCPPPAATDEQLMLCHDADYVHQLCTGQLDGQAMRRIGFPWSEAMVERSRRSVGATLAACEQAYGSAPGVAFNLAGGTHHAHRNFGSGYCCFNDAAVACHWMQKNHAGLRVTIIDLDVHQGDGTATILAGRPNTLTCSIHGASNFPFQKCESDIDIALADGTTDADYLGAVHQLLEQLDTLTRPDLLIYLAGVDPLESDKLGRLSISLAGLLERDRAVFAFARARAIPIAVAMAGGYSDPIELTVQAHRQTFEAAIQAYCLT